MGWIENLNNRIESRFPSTGLQKQTSVEVKKELVLPNRIILKAGFYKAMATYQLY